MKTSVNLRLVKTIWRIGRKIRVSERGKFSEGAVLFRYPGRKFSGVDVGY